MAGLRVDLRNQYPGRVRQNVPRGASSCRPGTVPLWSIGVILVVVGIILALLGMMDRAIGPRRYYY